MFPRIPLFILVAAPMLYSQKPTREMQELQRDVAGLQETVRLLQKSLEGQLATMGTQVQGAADAANKATAAAANAQKSVERLAQDQEQRLGSVGAFGSRMDQILAALGTMQQAMADLTATVGKLQTKVDDLSMAVKVIQQPPTPPAASGPSMPASELWINAERDRSSGKLDLALQEYADYLKWYADAPQAASAQYYMGWIHYSQKDYENALKDFDALISNYRDSSKLAEAYFYKGQTLTSLGRSSEAAESYRELRKRFPNHSLTRQIPASGRSR